MRRPLLSIATPVAALIALSSCGGGASRAPAAPSTGLNIIQIAGGSAPGGASTVSWSCFSRVGGTAGTFGAPGCPAPRVTLRALTKSAEVAAPAAPSALSATVTGSTVTLNWIAPVGGDAPDSYVVEAGSSTGLTDLASFDTGSAATALAVLNVPAGTYFVRVRAKNSIGQSGPSNEFLVVVAGAAPCGSLSAPTGIVSSVTGNTVVLTWTTPAGCAPTNYIIQAGSAPGLSNLANFSTGSAATSFAATGVGAGTYYLRLLSAAGGVVSAPSTEVVFVVGGCGSSPNAPMNLRSLISGSTVVLVWDASAGACPAASYVLQAGSRSGASDIANTVVTGTTLTATGVANGTYFIRVLAVNAVGQSAPSNEIAIAVGAAPSPLSASFVLFDPASQAGATTECRFRSQAGQGSPCVLSSSSTALAPSEIVSYAWTVQYTYGTVKTLTQNGSSPTLSIADVCGGPTSTVDGAAQPLNVTLTVTSSLGTTAAATSGTGTQPALQVRLFTCGS